MVRICNEGNIMSLSSAEGVFVGIGVVLCNIEEGDGIRAAAAEDANGELKSMTGYDGIRVCVGAFCCCICCCICCDAISIDDGNRE